MIVPAKPDALRWLLIGLWLASAFTGLGATVPTGEIVARIECADNPRYSYALYLPENYDPARAWPVLYCFDPRGQGAVAVGKFRQAAETSGYIVVGSHDSRNGPVEVIAIESMIADVRRRWNVDPLRSYAAGFSGGARIATHLAIAGLVKGVVGCGAGFPQGPLPDRVRFDFFGIAGTDDFNRGEMERLDQQLESRGAAHRLVLFRGGHEWMPANVAGQAFAWLDEQHKHAEIRARYDAFIERGHRTRAAAARALPPAESWLECQRLIDDFARLADVSELQARARELQRQPEVRSRLAELRVAARRYREQQAEFLACVRSGDADAVRRLVTERKVAVEPAGQGINARLLEGVLARVLAGARDVLERNDYRSGPVWLIAATQLVSDNAMLRYDLACVHALAGERDAAIAALEQAIALGFADVDRLEREAALATLRDDPLTAPKIAALVTAIRMNVSSRSR